MSARRPRPSRPSRSVASAGNRTRLATLAAASLLLVVAMAGLGGCSSGSSSSSGSGTSSGGANAAVVSPAGGGAASGAAAPAVPDTYRAATDDSAQFVVDCTFSHRSKNDPIVFPGQPGKSHSHDFFGNTGTDAASTTKSLLGGATSCTDGADSASYWVPTLSIHGQTIDPTVIRAYYRAPMGSDIRTVQPPPSGLQLLAGTPHPVLAQSTAVVGWGCGWNPVRRRTTAPDNCSLRSPLTLRLLFPDCWDGHHLVSADHRSHMAYSVNGACPADHPVLITQIQVTVSWPVLGKAAVDATLSSGGQSTGHGDFFNAWDEHRLRQLVDLCIRPQANCNNA